MKNLTKKAKIALTSAGAGALALAVALGIWQPWEKPEEPPVEPGGVQGEVLPPASTEEKLTLSVGGEKIPCTIFEGDGWQIYVPEEWKAEEKNGSVSISGKETVTVTVEKGLQDAYAGEFVAVYPIQSEEGVSLARVFYSAGPESGWRVACQAGEEVWNENQKLMTAMVRTMTVGEEKIFSGLSPVASEPDWQIIDGDTLLWMDKDAYVVDDALKADVEGLMMSWDNAEKTNFTGQYRMDELTWAGSYTCLEGREYVDVFRTEVWYEVAEGKEETMVLAGGRHIVDSWLNDGDPVYIVLFHDGSAVEEIKVIRDSVGDIGGADFAAELMKG